LILSGFINRQPLPSSLIQLWFSGGEAIDNECKNNFGKDLEEILEKKSYIDEMKQTPEVHFSAINLVFILDRLFISSFHI
jgi:hypothetical protein